MPSTTKNLVQEHRQPLTEYHQPPPTFPVQQTESPASPLTVYPQESSLSIPSPFLHPSRNSSPPTSSTAGTHTSTGGNYRSPRTFRPCRSSHLETQHLSSPDPSSEHAPLKPPCSNVVIDRLCQAQSCQTGNNTKFWNTVLFKQDLSPSYENQPHNVPQSTTFTHKSSKSPYSNVHLPPLKSQEPRRHGNPHLPACLTLLNIVLESPPLPCAPKGSLLRFISIPSPPLCTNDYSSAHKSQPPLRTKLVSNRNRINKQPPRGRRKGTRNVRPIKNHVCPTCDIAFPQRSSLNNHIRTVHDRCRPFLCPRDGCSAVFGARGDVTRHVSSVHDGHRPFQCNQCGTFFARRSVLVRHCTNLHPTHDSKVTLSSSNQ